MHRRLEHCGNPAEYFSYSKPAVCWEVYIPRHLHVRYLLIGAFRPGAMNLSKYVEMADDRKELERFFAHRNAQLDLWWRSALDAPTDD